MLPLGLWLSARSAEQLAESIGGGAELRDRLAAVGLSIVTLNGFPYQDFHGSEVKLRVYERGAGETLACGTGACAAVVAGIQQGWLDPKVKVQTQGGVLTIEWQGEGASVMMSGPATTVFTGEMEIPE